MDFEDLISKLSEDVKQLFENEGSGHDWWHIHRVMYNAINIAEQEDAEVEIVQIAALLHDVGDHKLFDINNGPNVLISKMLKKYKVSDDFIEYIISIVSEISYKGANVSTVPSSLEAKCVQDADRLDAIGAIGIARAFAYGGHKNRLIYDPSIKPTLHQDFDQYKNDNGHTINHFYEKLLLLKDRMQTETGKVMAQQRHDFLELFLKQFYDEWNAQ